MKKLEDLSEKLRKKIVVGERQFTPSPNTPVTNFLVHTKRHCNGGKTVDAGLWLRNHLNSGGKMFVSMSGAGSSFQMGIMLSELIRAGKIHGISVTGANMEESLYRYVAHSHYAYIPDYMELTPQEEKELGDAGLRRITDTFLPEDESVREILPALIYLWREAEKNGESLLWHEYFFQLFDRNLVNKDDQANESDCWLYQAWKYKIPVYVPGWEDSTMGNIFTHLSYQGDHEILKSWQADSSERVSPQVIKPTFMYMHHLAEWYLDNAIPESKIAFWQLGGGIAADFPICVVPHILKDYTYEGVQPWAGFVEIHSSPMSFGSYSGAGFKEKITWEKFIPGAYGIQIFGDYTEHAPDIAAIILGK